MTITLNALQKQRRDTASNWTTNNTVLLAGELGYETDTKKFKIGDGTTAWQSLDYLPIPDTNRLLAGNLTVGGNFTVNGTTTTIDTTTLTVEDKNIEIGKVSTPSDTTADGGGITLKGATDKTINWVDSTDSWTLSEHLDLASGKVFKINSTEILSATTLGSSVVSSSLTSVGTIATGTWNATAISGSKVTPDFGSQNIVTTGSITGNDLEIDSGTLSVDASNNRVGIGTTSPGGKLSVFDSSSSVFRLETPGVIAISHTFDGTDYTIANNDGSNGHPIIFGSKTAGAESIRIDSSGRLLLGTTTEGHGNGDDLTIATSGNTGLTIRSGTSDSGSIYFSDGTSGDDEYRGFISYGHDVNGMYFATDTNTRMFIKSDGKIGIGTTAPTELVDCRANATSTKLHIGSSDASLGNMPNSSEYGISLAGNNAEFQLHKDGSGNYQLVLGTYQGSVDIPLVFRTGSRQERMRLTSTGNLGIGVTSPTYKLEVGGNCQIITPTGGNQFPFVVRNDFTPNSYISDLFSGNNVTSDNSLKIGTIASSGGVILQGTKASDSAQKVKLILNPDGGDVGINTTSPDYPLHVNGAVKFVNTSTSITSSQLFFKNTTSGGQYRIRFDTNSSTVGSISVGTSSTAYNTSSDYRLKENITTIADGITRLKTLIPRRFNWKSDSSKTIDGFIAHEVTAVPEAIEGSKDAVITQAMFNAGTAEGEVGQPIYQQIDQSKLVPLLVAAVQELIGKVEALEAA